jgi:hypothetical protein
MKPILLFALAASTALVVDSNGEAESFRNLKPRIVGGDEASLGEYPYFGKRKLHESGQHALLTSLTSRQVKVIKSDSFSFLQPLSFSLHLLFRKFNQSPNG